jgi:hypothetical protein
MDNCVQDILAECGMWPHRSTPATYTLFDMRDTPKVTSDDVKFFRCYVAKLLYLTKRVSSECLVALTFLTTRVDVVDVDDMATLKRELGYLRATQHRGIVLRVGSKMAVHAYVHRRHIWSASEQWQVAYRMCFRARRCRVITDNLSKEKIVTKSSTEA